MQEALHNLIQKKEEIKNTPAEKITEKKEVKKTDNLK